MMDGKKKKLLLDRNKAEHAVQSYAAGVTVCIGDILSNASSTAIAKQC